MFIFTKFAAGLVSFFLRKLSTSLSSVTQHGVVLQSKRTYNFWLNNFISLYSVFITKVYEIDNMVFLWINYIFTSQHANKILY